MEPKALEKVLQAYMYKIAGINQMILTDKRNGSVIAAFSKFSGRDNIQDVSSLSTTLVNLSETTRKGFDMNTFEFGTGEKLFTVNGGDHLVLSAVSDASVQLGISRLYLKRFAERVNGCYENMTRANDPASKDPGLAEIFAMISRGMS